MTGLVAFEALCVLGRARSSKGTPVRTRYYVLQRLNAIEENTKHTARPVALLVALIASSRRGGSSISWGLGAKGSRTTRCTITVLGALCSSGVSLSSLYIQRTTLPLIQ